MMNCLEQTYCLVRAMSTDLLSARPNGQHVHETFVEDRVKWNHIVIVVHNMVGRCTTLSLQLHMDEHDLSRSRDDGELNDPIGRQPMTIAFYTA